MNIDFEAWHIFATVARLGSFTEAAKYHNLSKPTISKAITRLEQEIGSVLFHRTSRKLSLSASGIALLPHAQRINDEGQRAMEAAQDEAQLLSGAIKISVPLSFGLAELAPIMSNFMRQYPDIVIDMHLDDGVSDLIEDQFDIALRIGALHDSSLIATKIRPIDGHFIAAPSYVEQYGEPKHPGELADHNAIIYSRINGSQGWKIRNKQTNEDIIVKPKKRFQCNNGDMMLPTIVAGHGIAYLPDFICAKYIDQGQLINILQKWTMEVMALYIITPPSRHRPARLRVLMDYLKTQLGHSI